MIAESREGECRMRKIEKNPHEASLMRLSSLAGREAK